MFMFKRISSRIGIFAICIALTFTAGCAATVSSTSSNGTGSVAPSQQHLTPQQVVAIVCPPLQSALTQLQGIYDMQSAMGSASAAKVVDALNKASPLVVSACAAGASVDVTTVQSFVSTVLPSLAKVAGTLPLTPKQLGDVQTALLTAQVALGVYNVVQSEVSAAQASNGTAPAASSSVGK